MQLPAELRQSLAVEAEAQRQAKVRVCQHLNTSLLPKHSSFLSHLWLEVPGTCHTGTQLWVAMFPLIPDEESNKGSSVVSSDGPGKKHARHELPNFWQCQEYMLRSSRSRNVIITLTLKNLTMATSLCNKQSVLPHSQPHRTFLLPVLGR